jgi:hypothetical protein
MPALVTTEVLSVAGPMLSTIVAIHAANATLPTSASNPASAAAIVFRDLSMNMMLCDLPF